METAKVKKKSVCGRTLRQTFFKPCHVFIFVNLRFLRPITLTILDGASRSSAWDYSRSRRHSAIAQAHWCSGGTRDDHHRKTHESGYLHLFRTQARTLVLLLSCIMCRQVHSILDSFHLAKALKLGLVDKVIPKYKMDCGDLLGEAIDFAERIASKSFDDRRISKQPTPQVWMRPPDGLFQPLHSQYGHSLHS